jgi:glycosyltransferase involved in cell wall biosynthesis
MTAAKQRSLAILYDAAYPFIDGGGQRRIFEIAKAFVAAGWQVDWYAMHTWDGDPQQERAGIIYHGLGRPMDFYSADGRRSLRQALAYGWAVLLSRADFSSRDLVWCGQWPFLHLLALFLRLIPWRTHLLVDWWEVWGRQRWLRYHRILGLGGWLLEVLLVNLVSRVGHIVAISALGAKQIVQQGGVPSHIHHIPNGIDLNRLDTIPAAEGAVDLISFGRLADHKNIDHLLYALAMLKNDGLVLCADIVGDGPVRPALERITDERGIAEQVTFHGRLDDACLTGFLKRATLFVHPSTKEGGGSITLLEANACGLPVICYRHPLGIDPALVIEGQTGCLVSPVTPRALADAIAVMLKSASDGALKEGCRRYAARFEWHVIAAEYLALADRLAGSAMTPTGGKA